MTEPQRIAARLTNGSDLAAAALLVALCADDAVEITPEDRYLVRVLEEYGCVHEGARTPLGSRVAIILRARGLVRPYPGATV
jgi:hypothetical protein